MWLIQHAEFVVSNSFHATAFSIIFQKQFVVFTRKESINTRMQDLVSQLGISECLIQENGKSKLKMIDYKIVEKQLSKEVSNSKAYIMEVLNSKKID